MPKKQKPKPFTKKTYQAALNAAYVQKRNKRRRSS